MSETQKTTSANGVRKEVSKSALKLRRIYTAEFQKEGTVTAEIEQTITTKSFYPSKKIDSNLQNSLSSAEEFGFSEQMFPSEETRIAWVLEPRNATEASVNAKLAKANEQGASIYKVLSNQPILDDNQKYAVAQGLKSLDDFANSQIVRYSEGTKDAVGTDVGGQLILDKAGNPQYKRTFFWSTPKADVDMRDTSKVYISPEIAAEVEGAAVMQGQNI